MAVKRLATCPACAKERDVDAQRGLLAAEAAWARRVERSGSPMTPPEGCMRTLALQHNPRWFWACDLCLRSKAALAADVDREHLGLGTPFAAYVSRPFTCGDCGRPSSFSA